MAIVLRFVDKDGFVRECFFGVVHVPDTTTLTLKMKYIQSCHIIVWIFKIFEGKDMMVHAICEVSGMD